MPSVSRSMNDIMKLTPQASTTTSGLAIGGGNYRQSYVTVDGAAFNNAFGIGGNLPAGGSPISLDALEQMSVSVTPYDVRQSGFTGGAINAVTKSGTNEFKASAYVFAKSDQLQGDQVRRRQTVAERNAQHHPRLQHRRPDRQGQALRVRQLRARVEHHAGNCRDWPRTATARASAAARSTTVRRSKNSTKSAIS